MRYEQFAPSPLIEDKRPLGQRFQTLPMDGYLGAVGPGISQQMFNAVIEGLGADLPSGPVTPSDYRPRSLTGPDRPPAAQMPPWDPEYRNAGPTRQQPGAGAEWLMGLFR